MNPEDQAQYETNALSGFQAFINSGAITTPVRRDGNAPHQLANGTTNVVGEGADDTTGVNNTQASDTKPHINHTENDSGLKQNATEVAHIASALRVNTAISRSSSSIAGSVNTAASQSSREGTNITTPEMEAAEAITSLKHHTDAASTLASLRSSSSPENALASMHDIEGDEKNRGGLFVTSRAQGAASDTEDELGGVESTDAEEQQRGMRRNHNEMVERMIDNTQSRFIAGYGLRRRL